MVVIFISAFLGCQSKSPSQPAKTVKPQGQVTPSSQPEGNQLQSPAQESMQAEGYVYQPRDRRDPFVSLIVPTKKSQKMGTGRVGTLESYDISEFRLLAIAEKGEKYFALLATPDNRSFTVRKGTIVGFNKGRVEEITRNKVLIVEYSKDYKGDIHPKQITLEFLKER
jgi:Tfp pilus assembly protein PilP